MKLAMTNIADELKVLRLVIECVAIFVVDYLVPFQFSPKVLLHHPSVLERPLSRWRYLDGDVLSECAISLLSGINNSFGEHGKGSGMVHALQFFRSALFPGFDILANSKALLTLVWVVKSSAVAFAIRALGWCHRITANATGFIRQLFHTQDIIPYQTNCQWIFLPVYKG